MQGHGSVIGTSFNDKGAGPLHGGPATRFNTFFLVEGVVKNKGYCAFGGTDGDRIFTDLHGGNAPEGSEGVNTIVGGTGNAGVQRSSPWKSKKRRTERATILHAAVRLPTAVTRPNVSPLEFEGAAETLMMKVDGISAVPGPD